MSAATMDAKVRATSSSEGWPWAWRDAGVVAGREFRHWAARPGSILLELLFPVLIVLMFAYLLGGGMTLPGGGDYLEYLLPGAFGLSMLFGVESTTIAVTTDSARGITERFRSMPMSAASVLGGRAVADLAKSALGLVAMLACGLAVGWRYHDGLAAVGAAVGLLLLLRLALVWVGIHLGLLLKTPEAAVIVQMLVWPVGFLSNVFAATGDMPTWLGWLAELNPVSAAVTATRDLFGNPAAGTSVSPWLGENALLLAIAWPVVLLLVFLPLAVARYRRLGD